MLERLPFGKEELVLRQLLLGEAYPLQIVKRGVVGRGTVYVTLVRLEGKGWVTSRQEDPQPGNIGLPKRFYKLTEAGQKALEPLDLAREHIRSYSPPGAS